MNTALAILGGISFLVFGLSLCLTGARRFSWVPAAGVAFLFFLFSSYTIYSEGPLAFWTEHTRNYWGNQIWFDLLLAAGAAWYCLVPRARAVKMNLVPWFLLVVTGGSIGLFTMLARLLYLEGHQQKVSN